MLRFRDGTRVRVNGLGEIMAHLLSEGRGASRETAEEIMRRLEAGKNFIPSSERVRAEYAHALLEEYGRYIDERNRQAHGMNQATPGQGPKKP